MVLFVGLPIALNQFGWERNAASYIFAMPIKPRHLLLGKNLAIGLGLIRRDPFPLSTACDHQRRLGRLAHGAGPLAGCDRRPTGRGQPGLVITPLRLPREGTDIFAQATEQGFLALIAQLTSFLVIGLLLVPPSVAVVLTVCFGQVLIAIHDHDSLRRLWTRSSTCFRFGSPEPCCADECPEVVAWVQVH